MTQPGGELRVGIRPHYQGRARWPIRRCNELVGERSPRNPCDVDAKPNDWNARAGKAAPRRSAIQLSGTGDPISSPVATFVGRTLVVRRRSYSLVESGSMSRVRSAQTVGRRSARLGRSPGRSARFGLSSSRSERSGPSSIDRMKTGRLRLSRLGRPRYASAERRSARSRSSRPSYGNGRRSQRLAGRGAREFSWWWMRCWSKSGFP